MVEIEPVVKQNKNELSCIGTISLFHKYRSHIAPIGKKKSLPHKYHLEVTLDAFHKKLGLSITATPV